MSVDPPAVVAVINNRMTYEYLEDDQGHKVVHMKMKMPLILSNRSIVTCFYRQSKDDGTKELFHSSKGNEAIAEARASQIGSDVIATNHITYFSWKPYEGGMELRSVMKMDPNGSIPSMIKNKMGSRMAGGLKIMVDYLQNGTVPTSIF